MTRDCNLPIFIANETITNITQYELSQEESDLLEIAFTMKSYFMHYSCVIIAWFNNVL